MRAGYLVHCCSKVMLKYIELYNICRDCCLPLNFTFKMKVIVSYHVIHTKEEIL
jgi:hypothetical protein